MNDEYRIITNLDDEDRQALVPLTDTPQLREIPLSVCTCLLW